MIKAFVKDAVPFVGVFGWNGLDGEDWKPGGCLGA